MRPLAHLLLGAVSFFCAGLVYLAPALVAAHRGVPEVGRLLRHNTYLGWTGVVWLACLVVAVRSRRSPVVPPPAPAPRRHDCTPDRPASRPRDPGPWACLPFDTAPLPVLRPGSSQ